MNFFETYAKELFSLALPFFTLLANQFFKAKTRLELALPHQFTFVVQQPLLDSSGNQLSATQTVKTNSFIIRNSGREAATKVEIVFNWKPMCLNIWPVRHFDEYNETDKRYVLIFDSLAPGEVLGIEILGVNSDLPNLITARCAQGNARNISMIPMPIVSGAVKNCAIVFMTLGFGAAVYLAILAAQFLILRTPQGI